ncbi:MAG: hypothetical protein U1F54_04650 [Burkholderiales bacterium]
MQELAELRSRKHRWHSVAEIIARTIESRGWSAGQPALKAWLAQAAEASGLSLNTLGRVQAVRGFLNTLAREPGTQMRGDPDTYPMSSLEVLKRIHAINPALARDLLGSTLNGALSLRALRERHDALAEDAGHGRTPDRAITKRSSGGLARLAVSALQDNLAAFGFAPGHRLLPRRLIARAFVRTDALVYRPDEVEQSISGVCFTRFTPDADMRETQGVLYRLGYLSGFFRRLIVIVPSDVDAHIISDLVAAFKDSRRFNVALFEVSEPVDALATPHVKALLTPPENALPTPDCRASIQWERVIRVMLEHTPVSVIDPRKRRI